MRPTVVLAVLLVAFGVLGMIALFRGASGRKGAESANGGTNAAVNVVKTGSSGTGSQGTAGAGTGVMSDEMRAALVEKELDQIQQLQGDVDGSNNVFIINALLDKARNSEADVRKAAVQAIKEINDTNAIPGLEKLSTELKDPREMVAVLDAIDYLKLPNILPEVPPADMDTNSFAPDNLPPEKMNPQFMHSDRESTHQKRSSRRATPETAPATR